MLEEYFTIIHRYHSYRTDKNIRAVTKLQLEQLAPKCSPRIAIKVNNFLRVNFSEPSPKTW